MEALKEVNTLAEIAKKYKIYPQQIANWKKDFLSGASSVSHKGKAPSAKSEAELERDHLVRKIGELTVEIDLLKKSCPDDISWKTAAFRQWPPQIELKQAVPPVKHQPVLAVLRTQSRLGA